MTQEYTPTDQQVIDDYMPDEEDIGFDARTMSIGEWKRLKIAAFDRWLAAHDAQIRAEEHVKALELTDYELEILEDARTSSDEWVFGKDIEALKIGIEAVADHRKEQKQ